MAISSLSISHVDTCTPDYLQDHHNRSGELLLSVAVDGTTTLAEILDGLRYDFGGTYCEDLYGDEVDTMLDAALVEWTNGEDHATLFESSLDCPPSDDIWSDEYAGAVDYTDPAFVALTTDDERNAWEADARSMAQDEAKYDWENGEKCYAYFVVSYEIAEEEDGETT